MLLFSHGCAVLGYTVTLCGMCQWPPPRPSSAEALAFLQQRWNGLWRHWWSWLLAFVATQAALCKFCS